MILDELFEVVSSIMKDTCDIDAISQRDEVLQIDLNGINDTSDQDIDKFVKEKIKDAKQQELIFKVFQKIKIDHTIEVIEDEALESGKDSDKRLIRSLFDKIVEPNEIEISDSCVCIKYSYDDDSKLKEKIQEIAKWDRDNVVETVSNKFNVPTENITFIESVSSYIDFISGFEENNYVSRGQKDCGFNLEPSLYRIYNDCCQFHSSQYESAFKQRILYYDNSTDKKKVEELRAYGQHYGLPTNYLDFTEAHLISLLFAVEEYEYVENHSVVFFVDALSYNRDTIKADRKLVDFSDEELKTSLQREYSDKSYFIRVGNCNERIHFQKGCFLKVEQKDTLDKMFAEYTKIAIIDKECKKSILKELFKLGITFENIYPDKDNMVRTIKFMKEHM